MFDPFDKFAAAQKAADGRQLEFVQVGESRLFENGAKIHLPPTLLGSIGGRAQVTYRQPPFSEEDAVRFRLEFVKAKIADERSNFDRFFTDCQQQAVNYARGPMHCPPPPPDAFDQLGRGSSRIALLQLEEDELKRKLISDFPESPEAVTDRVRREIAEEKSRRTAEMQAYKDSLSSISRG